jgi:succinate dehydrogenase / fumarate reductase membrane anchor subunit
MVTNVLNYGRSGVADWVVQRFSALILAAYTVVMVIWLAVNGGELTFAQWQGFMGQTWVRIFTLLTVLALAVGCLRCWHGNINSDWSSC